jgi:UDP-4-amino-4,6-dideoxy-N-acetyl-beta-L-altrosamine transaminase
LKNGANQDSTVKRKFLPYFQPSIGKAEIEEVVDTLNSGWLTMGPRTAKFEETIADYTGARHAIAVNSCTAALHLSLVALGIGKGDEVVTTPFTFAATANVIIHTGAKPVFVDINRATYNIDHEKIERVITKRTRAIMPVHYAGQACDMQGIKRIAEKHNLFIIEDAAHAIGSEYEGKKIGTFGYATCFSFYVTKNITTGEGGAITTDNDRFADRLRTLRLHGISKDAWKRYASAGDWYYEIEECGWKYNMTDIQAALGIQQMKRLDEFIAVRREYAQIYTEKLSKIKGVITPYEKSGAKHVYHLYPILLKSYDRNKFVEQLKERNIGCSVHFIPLHLHPFYKKNFKFNKGDFPNAEWVYEKEVSLPLYPRMTKDDLEYVVNAVADVLNAR